MGTRGWLIFIYQGKYYIVWNNYDSNSRNMGNEIVKQLFALVQRFHGDIQSACSQWGKLLAKLRLAKDDERKTSHPFNASVTYFNIEDSLNNRSARVAFVQKPSTTMTVKADGIWVEYVWYIDLDAGSLAMCKPACGDFKRTWTMKSFYHMLLVSPKYLEVWVDDADSLERIDDERVSYSKVFRYTYSVVRVQAQIRRYLAVKRALEPGTGVLYLAAKQRFEKRSLQEAVAEDPVRKVKSRIA